VSPIVDGDLVIISGITFGWGPNARGAHRFMAFDKRTGETVWISAPGGRPYDTTYAPPIIANINGTALLIEGASDGVVYALKAQTVNRFGSMKSASAVSIPAWSYAAPPPS
jgi:outer membrane protein assembly factor BamB